MIVAPVPRTSPAARPGCGAASLTRPGLNVGIVTALGLVAGLGLVGAIAYFISIPAAGIIYAVGYMALTWIRPDLALLIMFAAAPFPYDVGGGPMKMAVAEINLVLATPVLVLRMIQRKGRITPNPIKWPVIAYFGVCLLSSLAGGITAECIKSMLQMGIYLILAVFIFSSCLPDLRCYYSAFYGFLIGAGGLALVSVITRQEYIAGIHKNAIGTNLSYAVIICGELWFAETKPRRRKLFGILGCVLIGGLLFSMSRGGWLGAMAGLGVITALRRQFKLMLRGLAVGAVVVALLWQLVPQKEQAYAVDFDTKNARNIEARLISIQYAMHYFETSPLLGVGVGLRKQYDATNVVMSTLAETGVLGLVTFLSIFIVFAWSVWRSRNVTLAGGPLFSLVAIGAALCANQFMHGCVDHYWNRVLLPVWGSVGMALYAQHRARLAARTTRPRPTPTPAAARPLPGVVRQ